jgi:hypothetical protein
VLVDQLTSNEIFLPTEVVDLGESGCRFLFGGVGIAISAKPSSVEPISFPESDRR